MANERHKTRTSTGGYWKKNSCTRCWTRLTLSHLALSKAKDERCKNCAIICHFACMCKKSKTDNLRERGKATNSFEDPVDCLGVKFKCCCFFSESTVLQRVLSVVLSIRFRGSLQIQCFWLRFYFLTVTFLALFVFTMASFFQLLLLQATFYELEVSLEEVHKCLGYGYSFFRWNFCLRWRRREFQSHWNHLLSNSNIRLALSAYKI